MKRIGCGSSYSSSGRPRRGTVTVLRWAFSEAAPLYLRCNPQGKKRFQHLERKHGKGKAVTILAIKLARAVYFMLRRRVPFDAERFARRLALTKN